MEPPKDNKIDWQKWVAKYQKPRRSRSIWQLVNTLVPYALSWFVMVKLMAVSFWLVLPVTTIAAGLLVRVFIIFHDCGHGSFFKSQRINNFWGFVMGLLCFTPYRYWRHEHAVHHANAGDLDNRGVGDVWTMTVKEYLKAPRWMRIKYRLCRNPICLFIIGPSIMFFIAHRIPIGRLNSKESIDVHLTNLGILAMMIIMGVFLGFKTYLLIQFLVVSMAASAGVWLFYVQHQFEGVYWERSDNWDYVTEALKGSSFFKLPKVLQWFTGNIGFHHIHHLAPNIPNYFLERCYNEIPLFQQIKPITFLASFKSLTFRLWDEQHQRLVGFAYLKKLNHL